MYLPEWVQKFKEPRTEIKKIKGGFYKYAVEYKYNSDKKRTDKITKHLLGKITETEGFVPSDKYSLQEKVLQIPRVDIKTFGVFKLFSSLLAEDLPSLLALFPAEISETLLSISMMRFAYQSPLKRIPYLHSHDFCAQHWVPDGLNDKRITSALRHIGENRNLILDWMKTRMPVSEAEINNFVMLDSTHIPTLSDNLHINVKGYNPSHSYDPQVRLMYIFSTLSKQPIYYRLINGNITDVKSMKKCVEEMDLKNVVFIADKGFYSKSNVENLKNNGLHYIIPLYRNNKLINFKPLQEGSFKKIVKNYFSYQNRIVWYYQYEKEGEKLVTFLDEKLRIAEENDYLQRTLTHPDKYTEAIFFEKMHQFGTLTLVSHLAETYSPKALYEAYKQRNEIETMFDAYKNFLEADKTYMQNRYVMEGWLMANFVAMIAYYRLFSRLKKANLLSKYSPKDIVEMSKSICQLYIRNQWTLAEITQKTIDLFKKIMIDYLI
jgi:hypothetical protein